MRVCVCVCVCVSLTRDCSTAIISEDTLREGKRQLQRHKTQTQRKFRRGDLKNFITASSRSEESLPLLRRLFFFLR